MKTARFVISALTIAASALVAHASPPVTPPVFSNPLAITNPYFPFPEAPGAMKVYAGVDDGEKITFVDTYPTANRAFMVNSAPVSTRILTETEFENWRLVEISRNYFGQADDGTVYYFGETVDIYDDGEMVSHDGSWLVGGATDPTDPVETANAPTPAVFMPGNPEKGDSFKPEDLFPIVDETATVIGTGLRVRVPAGRFEGAIAVRETTRLSRDQEIKWYAPGVGLVRGKAKGGGWFKAIAISR